MKRFTALRSEFFNRRDEEDVHGRAQLWRQAQRPRHFDGASLVGSTAAELRSLKRNAMSTVMPSVAARLSSTEPRVAVATLSSAPSPLDSKGLAVHYRASSIFGQEAAQAPMSHTSIPLRGRTRC